MTKDLSYSYVSLMPKDKREANIYYLTRLNEIAELYPYFQVIVGISIFLEIFEFNKKRDTFSFIILVLTITFAIIRLVAYLFRHRYLKAFSYHLVIIYLLTIIKIVVSTQHELRLISEEDIKEEEHLTILDKGQRRMTAIFILYIVFGTPNFSTGML